MKLTRADPGLIQLNLLLPFLLLCMALPTYKMSYTLTDFFFYQSTHSTVSFTKYCNSSHFIHANMHNCINISYYNYQTYLYENIFYFQTFRSTSRLTCKKLGNNK